MARARNSEPDFENVWSGLFPSGDIAADTVMDAIGRAGGNLDMLAGLGAGLGSGGENSLRTYSAGNTSPPPGPGYAVGVDYAPGAPGRTAPPGTEFLNQPASTQLFARFMGRPVSPALRNRPEVLRAMQECLDGVHPDSAVRSVGRIMGRLGVPSVDISAFEDLSNSAYAGRQLEREYRTRRQASGVTLGQEILLRNMDSERARFTEMQWQLLGPNGGPRAVPPPAVPAVVDKVRLEPIPTVALPEVKHPMKLRGQLDID